MLNRCNDTVRASLSTTRKREPLAYNLRFPGQYCDSETAKHYNYFRDYDASLGRYLQSDSVGLSGGINSFVYVGASSLRYADRLGLSPECGTNCCKEAISQGLLSGVGGTVVCCNGKKSSCVEPPEFGPAGPIMHGCAKQHEDIHLPFMFCFGGPGPQRAYSLFEQSDLECPAYRTEIRCLRTGLEGCGLDMSCTKRVKDTVATKITKGWEKYKCGLML